MADLRHLIVDGSNVMHAWADLRGLLKRDRDAARGRLVQRLAALHDVEGGRLTIVFDGRGPELVVEHPAGSATLACVYSPDGMTADDVIEQLVGRSADPGACRVVTDDQAERHTVEALGAVWCSAKELAARVVAAEARQGAKLARLRTANAREWRDQPPP